MALTEKAKAWIQKNADVDLTGKTVLITRCQRRHSRQDKAGSLVPYQCGEAVVSGKDQMPESKVRAAHP